MRYGSDDFSVLYYRASAHSLYYAPGLRKKPLIRDFNHKIFAFSVIVGYFLDLYLIFADPVIGKSASYIRGSFLDLAAFGERKRA